MSTSSRPLTRALLTMRGIASVRGGLVLLALVVLLAAAATSAWPRLTSALLTSDLRYRVDTASAPQRDLISSVEGISVPGLSQGNFAQTIAPTWASMTKELGTSRALMGPQLRALTAPGRFVGRGEGPTATGVAASGPVGHPAASAYTLSVEANPRLRSDAVLVSGRWPIAAKTVPSARPLEVAISADAAKTLGWTLGTTQTIVLDRGRQQDVKLVATLRPRDAASDYWKLDDARNRTGVRPAFSGATTSYHSVVWVASSSWPRIALQFGRTTIRSWFGVSSAALSVDELDGASGELQRFLSNPRSLDGGTTDVLRFSSNLGGIVDDFEQRAAPANTLLAIFATGPLGTTLALLILGVGLLARRRASALALLRARGASDTSVRVGLALETAVACVPAAIVGGVVGIFLTSGPLAALSIVGVLACAITPPLIAAASAVPTEASAPLRRRAWIIEVLVILLAILSVVVLTQHGLEPSAGTLAPDPLLALTPLLVASAACVLALRVFPYALGWIGAVLRRRRGAVGYLGWATSVRSGGAGIWPVFAVVVGVSITVFSLSILTTEREGVRDAAVARIGADASVTAPSLSAAELRRIRGVAGVEKSATVLSAGSVRLSGTAEAAALYLVDASDLAIVQAELPQKLRPLGRLDGPHGDRIPALVGGLDDVAKSPDATLDTGSGVPVRLHSLATAPGAFIGFTPWLVIDRSAVSPEADLNGPATAILLKIAPGTDSRSLQTALQHAAGADASVALADDDIAAVRSAPLVSGVESITLTAVLFSALALAAALELTLAMNSGARIRLLSRLRSLGFDRRQSIGLIAWELAPVTAVGILAGCIVGLGLPAIFLVSVDLSAFTGGDSAPPLAVDPALVGLTVLGFVAVAAIATAASIIVARPASPSNIIRAREEE